MSAFSAQLSAKDNKLTLSSLESQIKNLKSQIIKALSP